MSNLLSISSTFTYIGYIVIAILILLLMVLIHELGHYVAGKILKFKINEFSVGFGPKIFQKKKKNGELISLRVFPLGGYCAFEGETEDGKETPESFNNQKPWKRLIVLFSGAFFNFLSAIIFSFILLLSTGYDLAQVDKINQNSINYNRLETGDVIYGIDGANIDFVNDNSFSVLISKEVMDIKKIYNKDNLTELETDADFSFIKNDVKYYYDSYPINFDIRRDGKNTKVQGFVNVVYKQNGEYAGWTMYSDNNEDLNECNIVAYKYSFGEALVQAVPFTCKWAYKILIIFGQLITGRISITAMGGPVTTINMIAQTTMQSFSSVFVLLPLIAVNLAVFNLLPIPALDGFQMIFVAIEWIRKKPVKRTVVNAINNIGLLVLLGFVIVIDVIQFII